MTTVELPRYQHVIDGRRVESASGQRYDSVDPYLGQPWASAADGDAADAHGAPRYRSTESYRWPDVASTWRPSMTCW